MKKPRTYAALIRQTCLSIHRREKPGAMLRRWRTEDAGRVRTEWSEKGSHERRAKQRGGKRAA